MLLEVEGARSLSYWAGWALDNEPETAPRAASMAKAYAGDAGFRVTASALQVHGGIGFTYEHDLHFFLSARTPTRTRSATRAGTATGSRTWPASDPGVRVRTAPAIAFLGPDEYAARVSDGGVSDDSRGPAGHKPKARRLHARQAFQVRRYRRCARSGGRDARHRPGHERPLGESAVKGR